MIGELLALSRENEKLLARVEKLEKALEFYATCKEVKVLSEKSFEDQFSDSVIRGVSVNYVEHEYGALAREALKDT